jgi:hypothetical protein
MGGNIFLNLFYVHPQINKGVYSAVATQHKRGYNPAPGLLGPEIDQFY